LLRFPSGSNQPSAARHRANGQLANSGGFECHTELEPILISFLLSPQWRITEIKCNAMRHQCDREKSETVSLEIRIESLNRYQSSNRHSSDRLHFVRKLFKGHSCSDVSSNVTSIQKVQALRDQQIERNLPALGNEVVQGKFCLCPSEIPHFNQCA
jgi:hypothetical protein